MKPSEYPEQDSRPAPTPAPVAAAPAPVAPADPVTPEARPEAEKPRYLHLPVSPEESRAQRNLALAVICVVLAVIGLWLGLKFDRSSTLQCLAASLGTFGLLWIFNNFQLLRQRHGTFLGIGVIVLFGVVLPFVAAGLGKLDHLAEQRMNGQLAEVTSRTVPPPVPTAANAPAAPMAPELSPEDVEPKETGRGAASGKVAGAPVTDDGIVRDFIAPAPDPKEGRVISILKDCVVPINGRTWRLKAGQIYKLDSVTDGVVTFFAGDQKVSIETENVRFTGQSLETPEKIQQMAITEAATRYPALRDENTPEYRLYMKSMYAMKDDPGSELFFKNPRWPVMLADEVAQTHGWKRGDVAATTEPENPPAAPESDPNTPNPAAEEPSNGPQAAPPAPGKKATPPAGPGLPSIPKTPLPGDDEPAGKPGATTDSNPALPSIPKTPLPGDEALDEKPMSAPAGAPGLPSIPKTPLPGDEEPAEKASAPVQPTEPTEAAKGEKTEKADPGFVPLPPPAGPVPMPAKEDEIVTPPAPATEKTAEKAPSTPEASAPVPAPASAKPAPSKKPKTEKTEKPAPQTAIVPKRVQ